MLAVILKLSVDGCRTLTECLVTFFAGRGSHFDYTWNAVAHPCTSFSPHPEVRVTAIVRLFKGD